MYLPSISSVGLRQLVVADTGGSLATHPLTITTTGTDLIASDTSVLLTINYSSVTVGSNLNGSPYVWMIL
ncbi:hypothetical protein EBZ80_22045 [bacterium]|nr:hypothetical protein [bacterium]